MKTVIVASKNPVKLQAVKNGFARLFPGEVFDFQTVSTPSGVSDQPFSNQETLQGAANRAQNARTAVPEADFWAGIEGGVEEESSSILSAPTMSAPILSAPTMSAFAWVVILSKAQTGRGRTGTFDLPPRVAELVRQGKELGEADDIVFGRSNSKQENGAVGLLTGDVIDRTAFYEQAVILALIPFKNEVLYVQPARE